VDLSFQATCPHLTGMVPPAPCSPHFYRKPHPLSMEATQTQNNQGLICPSLRPWLEQHLHLSEAVSITTRKRRTKRKAHFSLTRNMWVSFLSICSLFCLFAYVGLDSLFISFQQICSFFFQV
jgi:hypothetical protein